MGEKWSPYAMRYIRACALLSHVCNSPVHRRLYFQRGSGSDSGRREARSAKVGALGTISYLLRQRTRNRWMPRLPLQPGKTTALAKRSAGIWRGSAIAQHQWSDASSVGRWGKNKAAGGYGGKAKVVFERSDTSVALRHRAKSETCQESFRLSTLCSWSPWLLKDCELEIVIYSCISCSERSS